MAHGCQWFLGCIEGFDRFCDHVVSAVLRHEIGARTVATSKKESIVGGDGLGRK